MSSFSGSGASAVLIGVDELSVRLRSVPAPVILDVRWALGDPNGQQHHLDGHIPGAVYVDMEVDLAGAASPVAGRHPLPALDDLARTARRWGIDGDSAVVVYDDSANMAAARAWWLLRWAGLTDVRLLDGGLAAWRAAGHALQTGAVTSRVGDVRFSGGHLPVLDADDAARMAKDGVLLDARAVGRYRGEFEPVDPRAGHIPGALSASTSENVLEDGTFASPSALEARFRALGIDGSTAIGVYCGSGVTAAHEVAALALAGFDAALYPGSWSQWSADPARPVETGD